MRTRVTITVSETVVMRMAMTVVSQTRVRVIAGVRSMVSGGCTDDGCGRGDGGCAHACCGEVKGVDEVTGNFEIIGAAEGEGESMGNADFEGGAYSKDDGVGEGEMMVGLWVSAIVMVWEKDRAIEMRQPLWC